MIFLNELLNEAHSEDTGQTHRHAGGRPTEVFELRLRPGAGQEEEEDERGGRRGGGG